MAIRGRIVSMAQIFMEEVGYLDEFLNVDGKS
jgi:hypothetical protein